MAANMQHMAGAGHMMTQQQQQMQLQQHARSNANQYGQTIMARLSSTAVPPAPWHASVPMNDRVGKTLELYVAFLGAHQLMFSHFWASQPAPSHLHNPPPLPQTNSPDRFTNVTLATQLEAARALEVSINFEISAFTNCVSKVNHLVSLPLRTTQTDL